MKREPKQQKTAIDFRLERIIEENTATPKNNPDFVNYSLRPDREEKKENQK